MTTKRKKPEEVTTTIVKTPTVNDLLALAVDKNANPDTLAKMLALKQEYDRDQARKAYAEAIVLFRQNCPTLKRNAKADYGQNKTKYTYTELPCAVEQIQPLMSQCGLAVTWTATEQSPQWLQVKAILTHVLGHQETMELGGPPDTSGSKNQLQAIKSTWSYLRRTTLFSLLGLVDKDELDNDGADGANKPEPTSKEALTGDPEAKRAFRDACINKVGHSLSKNILLSLADQASELYQETDIGVLATKVEKSGTITESNGRFTLSNIEPQESEQAQTETEPGDSPKGNATGNTPDGDEPASESEKDEIWWICRKHNNAFTDEEKPEDGLCPECYAKLEEYNPAEELRKSKGKKKSA